MSTLPANLPSVANAKIPQTYKAAKEASAECAKIDECKDWADKAEALASYAKQAGDNSLRKMADRIQARAIRRCGDLLKQIAPRENAGPPVRNGAGAGPITRTSAAKDAGLSTRQKKTALRVANVQGEEFEQAIESDDPPTVSQLGERGKKPAPLIDLKGRDPEDFKVATVLLGHVSSFCDFLDALDFQAGIRGASEKELAALNENVETIHWRLNKLAQLAGLPSESWDFAGAGGRLREAVKRELDSAGERELPGIAYILRMILAEHGQYTSDRAAETG